MNSRIAHTDLGLGAAVLAGFLAASAWAASAGAAGSGESGSAEAAGGLAEIVVTATRREERLQDVPVSVTAFSQEKLDAQGLKNIDDLTRLTPGITFQRNGMGSAANYNDENSDINIRGIDSTAGTSTTGIYVDDTPIQSRHIGFGAVNAFPQLFDLDRVEVLRGPQGTLFGAGSEGGTVRFITPSPNLKTDSGYLRAEVGWTRNGDSSYEAGAAFGAPIIEDVLGFRVSASFRRDGGWVNRVDYTLAPDAANPLTPTPVFANITEPNANWQETATFRAALKWQINDAVSLTPSIYYQHLQINDTASYWASLSNPGNGTFYNGNRRTNPSTDPFWLASVKLEWNLDFAQLTSNTSYYKRDQHSVSDYSQYLRATWTSFGELPNTYPPAGAQGYAPFEDDQRNFYEEIRLASTDKAAALTWNAGLFFSHLNENVPESIVDPTLNAEIQTYTNGALALCSASQPCPNGVIYDGPIDRVVDKQIALFGEASYKFTDTLKATLGVRFSKIDYTGTVSETGPFLGETIVSQSSASEKPVTPKLVLSWQPDHDNLYYASASKGFRPGGVNIGVGDICGTDLTTLGLPLIPGTNRRQVPGQFASDNLWSYELGGKVTLLDHRLQVNASLFFVDWKNIQQNVYLPSCGEQFTANLGKVRSVGGDIEIIYRPIDPLTLDLTAAYTDAKYTNSSCAGVLTFTGAGKGCNGVDPTTGQTVSAPPVSSQGDRLVGAPWSFTAAAEYHFAEWMTTVPYLRADFQYTTAQTGLLNSQDTNNALFDQTIPGLPVTKNLSLRAGYRFNGFDVSVFAQNLTNAQPLLYSSRDIATGPGVAPVDTLYFDRGVRPRTIGITGTYRF